MPARNLLLLLGTFQCLFAAGCPGRGASQTVTLGYAVTGKDHAPALMLSIEGSFFGHTGSSQARAIGLAATASVGARINGSGATPYAAVGADYLPFISRGALVGFGAQLLYDTHWGAAAPRLWFTVPVAHTVDAAISLGAMFRCQFTVADSSGCGAELRLSRERFR
jgi:hypothetical protein